MIDTKTGYTSPQKGLDQLKVFPLYNEALLYNTYLRIIVLEKQFDERNNKRASGVLRALL